MHEAEASFGIEKLDETLHRFAGSNKREGGKAALVQIRGGPDSGRFARFDWDGSDYAVRAACQISGILAVRPASLPILN